MNSAPENIEELCCAARGALRMRALCGLLGGSLLGGRQSAKEDLQLACLEFHAHVVKMSAVQVQLRHPPGLPLKFISKVTAS